MSDTHIKIKPVVPKVQYTGNGVTTVFPYEFPIFDETDMVVYVGDDIIESGYSVSGAGETDGGNVTFDTAPDDGAKITLLRNVPIERLTDFQEGGTFRPKNLNDEFDRQTAFAQQVAEELSRAVKTGPTSDMQPEEVLEQIELVYPKLDKIEAVADDLTNVDTVATNIADVNTCTTNMSDINTVAENISDITSKANKDMDNLTSDGKKEVANLCMPSSSYDTLTFGVTGTSYTAPANGYFLIMCNIVADNWCQLSSSSGFITHVSSGSSGDFTLCCPVKKSDVVTLNYVGTSMPQTWNFFRFYYAQGEV